MEITANASQTIATNGNVLFTDTVVPGNCSIFHREDSGLVTLRALPNGQCRARFRVYFNGNIKADTSATVSSATAISLAIAINGEAINSTIMTATVEDTTATYNVAASTFIDVPTGCCQTVSVKSTSTIAIDALNSNLIVERVA